LALALQLSELTLLNLIGAKMINTKNLSNTSLLKLNSTPFAPENNLSGGFSLFSVPIRNCKMQQAIDTIIQHAQKKHSANFAFVNADCLNKVWNQEWYRKVLLRMEEVYADGIGVKLAAKMKGIQISENVNGTDLFPLLCQKAAKNGLKIFLLGSRADVVEQCAKNMQKRFPELVIAGTQHGYFHEWESEQVINNINNSAADIVVVALGAPLQEFWADHYKKELLAPVCIGVGGCFDFYSGRIPRAPLWLRAHSMEWVWRLMQEPKRMWQRYIIGNPLFLYRAWKLSHSLGEDHV